MLFLVRVLCLIAIKSSLLVGANVNYSLNFDIGLFGYQSFCFRRIQLKNGPAKM